jgi:hypothetical protein
MTHYNIIVDQTFFIPFFEWYDLLDEMLGIVRKGNIQFINSPLEAVGRLTDDPIICIDALFDKSDPYEANENIDRFSWLDVVKKRIIWLTPYDETPSEICMKHSNFSEMSINASVYRNVFPSPDVFKNANVFFESNLWLQRNSKSYYGNLLRSNGLIPPEWQNTNLQPIDYSVLYHNILSSRRTNTLNFKEYFR